MTKAELNPPADGSPINPSLLLSSIKRDSSPKGAGSLEKGRTTKGGVNLWDDA